MTLNLENLYSEVSLIYTIDFIPIIYRTLYLICRRPFSLPAKENRRNLRNREREREQFGLQNLLPCYTEAAAGGRPTPVFIDAKMGSTHWTAAKRRRCEMTVSDIYNHHGDRWMDCTKIGLSGVPKRSAKVCLEETARSRSEVHCHRFLADR